MEIKNSFQVSLPPAQAWAVLMDIPRIVPCMPGAELVEKVDDKTYKGKVAVKLGPIALSFAGTATFEELDAAARRARLRAQGSDAKGRGTASATVSFALEPIAEGTQVDILTDVMLAGSIAQYGRASGMIQGIATQLIGQFASCLEQTVITEVIAAAPATFGAGENPGTSAQHGSAQAAAVAKPISGLGLIWQLLRNYIAGLFTAPKAN